MSFYLVERYVPSMSERDAAAATERLAGAQDPRVRHLLTVLLPGEDTCLSVFEATERAAVEEANQRAGFPVDRIVEASVLRGGDRRSENP